MPNVVIGIGFFFLAGFKLTSNGDVERIFPGEMFAYHFLFRYTMGFEWL